MVKKLTKSDIEKYINDYLDILNKNFSSLVKKKMTYNDIYDVMQDLNKLFNEFYDMDYKTCADIAIKKYIPLLNMLIKIDKDKSHNENYIQYIHDAYRIASRISLEHYFIYREWNERDKFFAPRYKIMQGYVHYLQEIATNPKFELLIVNMPSGYGKSFPEKISEAWNFGLNDTQTVAYICSNEDVVKGGSRAVIDEIKSDHFGEVFPNLKWEENDKKFFLKETEGNWKLRNCKLPASYYAKTAQANAVGYRASQRIHIDDLYADYKEAMNQSLNDYYFNKYISGWRQRFVQNKIPKIVVTGTLWASGDFIAQMIADAKKNHKFIKHSKYPYTFISEDGTTAIIQVPALDYQTGLSVCPELKTTEEIMKDKNRMDEYLFQTNFQQIPTDPEALFFSYGKLKTYNVIPKTDYLGTYSVIDATRKSGKDFFAMPIFNKVPNDNNFDYYLKDCLFTRTATKDMYENICNKIITNHIVELVIESNVTSELKQNIDIILKRNGINYCIIREKYNCENKQARIETEKGNILRELVFPAKNLYGVNTEMGKFMDNLTLYNSDGRNPNDDAPDSCAMFTHEIIDGGSLPAKVKPIMRPF